jgi:hypothetical protein
MKGILSILMGLFFLLQTHQIFAQTNFDTASKFTLQEAKVNKKLPSNVAIVNDRYIIRGMFRSMVNVKTLDFIDNPPPDVLIPIMEYLRGKINGLYINKGMNGNYVLSTMRVNSFTDDGGVKLYVDEQMSDPEFLYDLYPRDVALVKYFPPGGSLTTGGSASSATLAIYTRKGEDLNYYADKNQMKKSDITKMVDSLKKDH